MKSPTFQGIAKSLEEEERVSEMVGHASGNSLLSIFEGYEIHLSA
jgi:hypothetical protein